MPPRDDARREPAPDPWEVVDLLGGFGIVALPLFMLALPAVVLLGYLLLPLAILGLAAAVVIVPPLAVARAIRARRRRAAVAAARPRHDPASRLVRPSWTRS